MRLVSLVNSKTREKSKEYLGKVVEILCEDYDGKKGVYLGRDEYGRMGYFPSSENAVGKFVNVKHRAYRLRAKSSDKGKRFER